MGAGLRSQGYEKLPEFQPKENPFQEELFNRYQSFHNQKEMKLQEISELFNTIQKSQEQGHYHFRIKNQQTQKFETFISSLLEKDSVKVAMKNDRDLKHRAIRLMSQNYFGKIVKYANEMETFIEKSTDPLNILTKCLQETMTPRSRNQHVKIEDAMKELQEKPYSLITLGKDLQEQKLTELFNQPKRASGYFRGRLGYFLAIFSYLDDIIKKTLNEYNQLQKGLWDFIRKTKQIPNDEQGENQREQLKRQYKDFQFSACIQCCMQQVSLEMNQLMNIGPLIVEQLCLDVLVHLVNKGLEKSDAITLASNLLDHLGPRTDWNEVSNDLKAIAERVNNT